MCVPMCSPMVVRGWVRRLACQVLAVFAILLTTSGQLQAGIINGSFEAGLTGWVPNNPSFVSVVGLHVEQPGATVTYNPTEGSFFALLETGLDTGVYTTLSQTFFANAGDTLSGYAFFDTTDYLPYNDDGYVRIVQGNVILFSSSVSAVGNFGQTPWTFFSYTFPISGWYTIEAGVRNVQDNSVLSYLGLDAVRWTPVPEPSSLGLFGAVMSLLAGYYACHRRKRGSLVRA